MGLPFTETAGAQAQVFDASKCELDCQSAAQGNGWPGGYLRHSGLTELAVFDS